MKVRKSEERQNKKKKRVSYVLSFTDASDQLKTLCKKLNVKLSGPFTVSRVLDRLISDYIEPECIQPTFLYNHPLALSPLAKDADDNVH